MFKLNLVIRRKSENVMIFSPAPWFRILFLFFAAAVIVGIFTVAADDESISLVSPIVIAAICIIASMYEESWTVDREKRLITERSGLFLLHKTRKWGFNEVESLELRVFLRGAETDGSADHEVNLTPGFSREDMEEAAGKDTKIIHKRYQQMLRLNLKSGETRTIESLAGRSPDTLQKKADILSEFSGIKLEK
ncbi:MAG: hypothetical protein PQJ61_06260 [Spirochaetales bacterium]|uniref:Uncharacterized protein n=1 Tax=Candidatus Thalassospirochaeta sargassi TaxID=3119039 RepID=A0AAJ1IBR1_9SPIO|nr:hypothetical protein [Spirochaetales bacterium]